MFHRLRNAIPLFCIAFTSLALSSCASNGYANFYTPRTSEAYAESKECKHYPFSEAYLGELLSQGYTVVGTSSFEGALQSASSAVRHGKSIGADIVLTASEYSRTETGTRVVPIYTPGETYSTTTYHSGSATATGRANVNVYGSGGYAYGTATSSGSANYSGTSTSYHTTPGSMNYVNIPYSVARYNQQAVYLRSPNSSNKGTSHPTD